MQVAKEKILTKDNEKSPQTTSHDKLSNKNNQRKKKRRKAVL